VKNRVAVLHGVNLNTLGRRPAEHYGTLTLAELERQVGRYARDLDLETMFFQTNHEGEFVEELHKAREYADGLVLNPGAWTHYAWSLRDALEVAGLPAVEVHLSAVEDREPFRRISVLEGVVLERVSGAGVEGYRTALERLKSAIA
jgi:3-dehydroquinate dehydratase II